ncbi:DUF1840 domain-containing protein [Propionivibrio limicola]|uniref:DUF1840 domain-containing protein n=1 Tax=Propionivibrio limicola TaxID=167645 RepID=UPI0012909C39|nr:DUF1840 domain-containing protein [Propionivibrio limicola]
MLVKLISSTSGEMIMFGEHAHGLFEQIGKACTARGVFTKEQLPEAIERLQRAVDEEKLARHLAEAGKRTAREQEDSERDEKERDKEADEPVCLSQRAIPLIRLMEWTLKEGGFILWEAPGDF